MKLILVRHGDAGAYTSPDNERNLSELGKAQATKTAQFLSQFTIDQAIASPYNRARQTAEILTDLPLTICPSITPDDNAKTGLLAIAGLIDDKVIQKDGTVLVVCHMNIIAKMADLLDNQGLDSFSLAESRIFELPFVGAGQGVETERFVPIV